MNSYHPERSIVFYPKVTGFKLILLIIKKTTQTSKYLKSYIHLQCSRVNVELKIDV